MKAAVLTGLRQMLITDLPTPFPGNPRDVLLRMECVGVCGSDVHYYSTGRIGSQTVQYPFPVGHEASGVVEEVGTGVTTVKPGDRVAVDPGIPCHGCDQCRSGRSHTCRDLVYLGCPGQLDGCLGEFLVMPEECCYPVPDHVTMEEAALVEPLSIGLYAVEQSIPMAGAKVGIFGAGPIGLSAMLPALSRSAEAVYVTDRLDYRCSMALEHGATWTGNPDHIDVVKEITDQEPLLLDVAFECCGQQEALDQAVELLRPGGKLMIVGIPEFDRYSYDAETARRREHCFQNVRRQNGCVQKAIDLVASGKIKPGFMVTHRFDLDACCQAFELLDDYADGVVKAMVSFS